MAKKLTPSQALAKVDKQIDKGFRAFVLGTQGKLTKDTPVDTGRAASSWFISKDAPSFQEAPERTTSGSVEAPKYGGPITFDGDWYITNNLPYAERISLDPKWSKGSRKGANWFRSIQAGLKDDLDKYMNKALGSTR